MGYAAPTLLIIVRLCQGVATGGELVGAFIFLIEAAPTETRGFWGAMCFAGANLGTALGAAVGAIIREFTKEKQVRGWDNICTYYDPLKTTHCLSK